MSRRMIPRSMLNLDPVVDICRCFVLQRVKDRAIRLGLTEDLRSRLGKLESASPGENLLLASFPSSKTDFEELVLLLAPYKIRKRWYRYCPELATFVAGIRFARSTSSTYEDHLDVEVLRPSEAVDRLNKFGVDDRHLRQWARPALDVFETQGGHTRYSVAFVDRLRDSLSGMEAVGEFSGVTFLGDES